jgi:hypothetical protein
MALDATKIMAGNLISDPAITAAAVTKSDTAELAKVARGLYVGGAGAVTVITAAGDTVAFGAVTAGSYLPLLIKQVKSTGTDATHMVAFF